MDTATTRTVEPVTDLLDRAHGAFERRDAHRALDGLLGGLARLRGQVDASLRSFPKKTPSGCRWRFSL